MPVTIQPRKKVLVKALGTLLADRRAEAGLSQEAIAERLGIGQEAISRIERGVVSPSIERLLEFCEVFDCSIEELLGVASERPTDRAMVISRRLSKLADHDQEFVLGLIDQLCTRLARTHRVR